MSLESLKVIFCDVMKYDSIHHRNWVLVIVLLYEVEDLTLNETSCKCLQAFEKLPVINKRM